ncbi:MATH and UCH domain protein, putative [Talaromyces stipitatus ATCC 10500]|uniref:MATH and UCH domain protein, putative n=1 Tax=Talaromyces stipitatus (strain ATCC 10500 / CBS 375.48 / QM 6759 / NRRL 1006) TaxID=441959 RepID=B8LWU9_TALSN|nr:MATH and UCH domain protein, putative [Talaromyces stipitatus ATCC 10500]EED24582.1 MATH and UCH domain protein, putative [Talaromyces stipitatus ATCC 10500]
MDPVQEPAVIPSGPVPPVAPVTIESANTPGQPEEVQQTSNLEMDTSEDTTQPPQAPSTEETQNTEPATETTTEIPQQTEAPAAEAAEEPNPTEETTQPSETEPAEQPESAPAPPEEEPATWAGVEEDTSSPDEEELKKIESSDGDYSALEYDYWEKSFYNEVDDPEYRPAEKARLTWQIKGVRGTKEKPNRAKVMRSPPAYVGGYWWTIKFFPRGNGSQSLSIYVECSKNMPTVDEKLPETEFTVRSGAPTDDLKESEPTMSIKIPALENSQEWYENYKKCYSYTGVNCSPTDTTEEGSKNVWRVSAQIGVIMYNPNEPRTGWMQSSCHQFNPHNLDWGWTYFHGPWDEIHRRQKGQRQALLRNDTLAFDAYIRVFDDPTLSLWWHPSDSEPVWDSLAVTGYRPIGDSVINHSAEVAGLAAWVNLAPFRKIIQSVDVQEHRRNCNVKPRPFCEALQEFLWRLRHQNPENQCVDTDKVTSTLRNLHEYSSDVVEFWERMRRTLEIELEGTGAVEELAQLFDSPPVAVSDPQGSNVTHTLPTQLITSVRIPVDKETTIQGALSRHFKEQSGRWSLPPVLHVELSRQCFAQSSRQWKLLYNRVDLDEVLDLAPYVAHGQSGEYDLYGFVIHRGRRTSGKFFSILRPGGPGSKWVAFDDGSHNRVECLTRKAALESHVGLDDSKLKDANDKTGHDFAVAALYVRHDVVNEYLPGKLEPWDVAEPLRTYFQTESYQTAGDAESESKAEQTIQVEVYGLPTIEESLPSIFDTYDLMSQAKRTNNVMYLTLPKSTSIAELRKKIAFSKSSDVEQIPSHRVKLWTVGHAKKQLGAGLLFDRQDDLAETLAKEDTVVRFWTYVLSEEAAKSFAVPEPTVVKTLEEKPEGAVEVRDAQDSDEERPSAEGSGSSAAAVPEHQESIQIDVATPAEPVVSQQTENSSGAADNATGDVTISGVPNTEDPTTSTVTDAEPMDVDATALPNIEVPNAEPVPADSEQSAQGAAQDTIMEDSPSDSRDTGVESTANSSTESPTAVPDTVPTVPHVYYFVQVFDTEKQSLKPAGAFISALSDNVKSEIRKNMGWEDNKDFLIWSRIDNTSVVAVSSSDTFSMSVGDGHCFIVGDRLNKEQRAKLGASGLFTNPDRLVQYIWASSRRHPTRAFTGTKTVDATFNGDYYSGEFSKGYYHGKGTHISDTGTVYNGEFIFGQRHGRGKMEYPSGDTYEGDWVEDQRHGQGTFIESKTGNKYVGGYKDGKRHGKGISYWEVADEEMDLCQICYGEEQDALFYDCGHVCACVTCAREVEICPICRKNVLKVVKIYKM